MNEKKILNKKGFTLIEIIVCIALISLISLIVFTSIPKINNNKKEKIYKQFDDALEVYLSNHSEIYNNLEDNAEGAVISLNILKNEGLVKDNIVDPETKKIIDYENEYYVLSDAVLMINEDTAEEKGLESCNGMIGISILKSWDTLKDKVNTDEVIYVCPKSDLNSTNKDSSNTKELEERISKLETIIQRTNMNDKNYVIFDVESDTTQFAYFPDNADNNEYKDFNDIWRIVKNNSSGTYTLMYNQNIKSNYSSLFPSMDDIISYDSNTLKEITKKMATSYDNCKDQKYITDKVYSINAAYLGNYYSFGSDSDTKVIQGLYKIGNHYYESISKYNNTCSYYKDSNKIENIDNYLRNNIVYSFLKKDSTFKSYFFSDNYNYSLSLLNESNKLDYISLFDLRDTNPFKKALYDKLNSNLKNNLISSKKSYSYFLMSDTNILFPENDSSFNSTYFRLLTNQEVKDNQSWLSTFTIPIGIYLDESYLVLRDVSYINKVVSKSKYSPKPMHYVYAAYGEIVYQKSYIVSAYSASTIGGDSSRLYLKTSNPSYDVSTVKYNPVIDLKDATLLTNINQYSSKYREKRSSCTSELLGTYDCPYLLKLGDYYSDGNQT